MIAHQSTKYLVLQAVLLYYLGDLLMALASKGHRGAEQTRRAKQSNVSYIQVHTVHVCRVCTYKHSRPIQPSYLPIVYISSTIGVFRDFINLRACEPAYLLLAYFIIYMISPVTKGAKVKVPKCFWYRSGKIPERTRPWLARSLVTFISYLPYP